MSDLAVEETPIPGLLVLRLPLHEDARGWFKENWQREKMTALGLPDFRPVQNNISFNVRPGVTRGIHAEPWDKYVSVLSGRGFGAWVDLRQGDGFGRTHHLELDPSLAVFVPRGVGNAFQALEGGTVYSYLVTEHWRPDGSYAALALDDPAAAIPWPIPISRAEVSDKDRRNPPLDTFDPMPARRPLILGARGQLGRALMGVFPDAEALDVDDLDLTDASQVAAHRWHEYDVVLNATGYTAVDAAESPEGRVAAWAVNAVAPARLAAQAQQHSFVLVHYSSDYVFDGRRPVHREDEPLSPLGVYGQSKAAGDLAVTTAPRHYLIRTSWVVGDGHNFVRTMAALAARGTRPSVVDDQFGRLTFTEELARATRHLLDNQAPFGPYNCTNAGPAMSWAAVARQVFQLCGRSGDDITPVTTEAYGEGRTLAPRPRHSVLDLSRLQDTGYRPEDAGDALERYLSAMTVDASS